MKYLYNSFLLCLLISLSSCIDDLNVEPEVEQTLNNLLEQDPNAAKAILSKIYGSLALHGQGVPGGTDQREDIRGDDPGETVYLRSLWNLQEMTTDVVKNRWGDGGLDPLTVANGWNANNKFFGYMYNKAYFIIGQSNNFINDLNSVDVPEKDLLIAEARFLRALMYYNLMDCFGDAVIVTEADGIGPQGKPRSSRSEVFNFVESELLAVESVIPDNNDYGRANKATVHMALAKIYLNAEVFAGTNRYDDCASYCTRIITESPFSLDSDYQSIFQGDNHNSPEIIFPIIGDRDRVQSFGNATYLVNGSYGSETMPIDEFGAQNGWVGHRCTPGLYSKFGNLETTRDTRAIFWTEGHTYEMEDYQEWTHGYPTTKFRNTFSTGESSVTNFSDIDFPLFRLADTYLMYAECALRGASGSTTGQALSYVNALRERSFGDQSGNISEGELTLDFIIDERARELYYEAHRRQDLIRFGLFTGGRYIWPWKGGVAEGTNIPDHYDLFPLPQDALGANPNINQNPGF